jgi:hypothetical protein
VVADGRTGEDGWASCQREETPVCRSIKTLREPFAETVTDADVRAAALQYVRKISGFRQPAPHNAAAFDEAVAAVTAATQALLDNLVVRPAPNAAAPAERAAKARAARMARTVGG